MLKLGNSCIKAIFLVLLSNALNRKRALYLLMQIYKFYITRFFYRLLLVKAIRKCDKQMKFFNSIKIRLKFMELKVYRYFIGQRNNVVGWSNETRDL